MLSSGSSSNAVQIESFSATQLGSGRLLPVRRESVEALRTALVRSPVDLSRCTELVLLDPGLAAHVLRMGAAAIDVESESWPTMAACIVASGIQELISVCDELLDLPERRRRMLADTRHHALACARLSEWLGTIEGIDPEKAYLAGLLHDLGRLVTPGHLTDNGRHSKFHTTLGMEFANQWELPTIVIEAISATAEVPEGKLTSIGLIARAACQCSTSQLSVNPFPQSLTLC